MQTPPYTHMFESIRRVYSAKGLSPTCLTHSGGVIKRLRCWWSCKACLKTCCVEYLGVKSVCIPAGTKIAQMRIVEIPNTELVSGVIKKEENDDKENGDKKRGDNGFNSTGVK